MSVSQDPRSVDLSTFAPNGLVRGRSKLIEVLWWILKVSLVQSKFPWPSIVRKKVLVFFGAQIGKGFYCRPELNVHFPWKLIIGDNVWLGDRATLHNIEPIVIGNNTALGHEVFITTGGHNLEDPSFGYQNKPVKIEDSVWLGSRSVILAGVTVRRGSVVAAGAVVTKDVAEWSIQGGVPAKYIRSRSLK